jgi:AcrR family transcriptional regulator
MAKPANKLVSTRRRVSREGLLAAALEVFLTHGFQAARVEDIAQLAGVGKGSVYLHFRDKESLFQAVVDECVVTRLEQAEALANEFSGTATELLGVMLHNNLIEFWGSQSSGIHKLVIAESQRFPELASNYYRTITLRARSLIESVLKLGIAQDEYRDMDVRYTARFILNALDNEVIQAHAFSADDDAQFDPHRFIDALLELVTKGLAKSSTDDMPTVKNARGHSV